MPVRDLHEKPFSEGTKIKLEIYRSYVRAWLQVFLHATAYIGKPLQFYDFFCGPGQDATGEPGSPLILINELLALRAAIEERRHEIRIFFNDQNEKKIDYLKRLCSKREMPWKPRFESLDFPNAFKLVRNDIGRGPSVVFIDQNGLKYLTKAVFDVLTNAPTTDFIFFVASSFKWRFGDLLAPEIHFPVNTSYIDVHRVLADICRNWAPENMFIGHFSIMKETNIYGLVFGTQHWRGMQKFLEIAWKIDRKCGEANYQMESDIVQGEMNFETGKPGFKKRKVELFQERLASLIKAREKKTDKDIFLHCLTNGFLPRVAKDVYIGLRDDGVLKNAKPIFPRCSADAMKDPRTLHI
jgi:hypothetical protein